MVKCLYFLHTAETPFQTDNVFLDSTQFRNMCRTTGFVYHILRLLIMSSTYHIKVQILYVKVMQTKVKSDHGKVVKIKI